MSTEPGHESKVRRYLWGISVLLLLIGYVLSEAPVRMLMGKYHIGSPPEFRSHGGTVVWYVLGDNVLYKPADLLIANTPLRHPLALWGKLWDVTYVKEIVPAGPASHEIVQ
ncbi:MAG: hypothetical protein KDA86_05905 [Planctomycetaceae bacterium]|nr:hypothetical protein [Planctomycetaceae bacterium]